MPRAQKQMSLLENSEKMSRRLCTENESVLIKTKMCHLVA
jgi:hypothetical protein